MTTSKKIASQAGKEMKTNPSARVRRVAASDVAQAKKPTVKKPASKSKGK